MPVTRANTGRSDVPPGHIPSSQSGVCTGMTCYLASFWWLLLSQDSSAKRRNEFWRIWQIDRMVSGETFLPLVQTKQVFPSPSSGNIHTWRKSWHLQGSFWLLSGVHSLVLCRGSILTCSNLLDQTGCGSKTPCVATRCVPMAANLVSMPNLASLFLTGKFSLKMLHRQWSQPREGDILPSLPMISQEE